MNWYHYYHQALVSLAREALKQLEIDEAIRAYRELQDPAMVLALKAIRHIEVRKYLYKPRTPTISSSSNSSCTRLLTLMSQLNTFAPEHFLH
jgi:hypothetical protein